MSSASRAGSGTIFASAPTSSPANSEIALEQFGFYPHRGQDGALEIEGANGEVLVDTKDGVQYVLRFGNLAAQVDIASTTSKKKKDDGSKAEDQVKVQRYLFVTTQLAPSILKEPELEDVPAGTRAGRGRQERRTRREDRHGRPEEPRKPSRSTRSRPSASGSRRRTSGR